jgi:hypothetical protein
VSEHDVPSDASVHVTVVDDTADVAETVAVVDVDDVEEPSVGEVATVEATAVDVGASHQIYRDATQDDATDDDDATQDHETDEEADARLEGLDDGSVAVGGTARPAADALPFTMSAREHFAAVAGLDDTGDARVDAATARLAEVPDLPTTDHVEVYEDVHRRLQEALAEAEVR